MWFLMLYYTLKMDRTEGFQGPCWSDEYYTMKVIYREPRIRLRAAAPRAECYHIVFKAKEWTERMAASKVPTVFPSPIHLTIIKLADTQSRASLCFCKWVPRKAKQAGKNVSPGGHAAACWLISTGFPCVAALFVLCHDHLSDRQLTVKDGKKSGRPVTSHKIPSEDDQQVNTEEVTLRLLPFVTIFYWVIIISCRHIVSLFIIQTVACSVFWLLFPGTGECIGYSTSAVINLSQSCGQQKISQGQCLNYKGGKNGSEQAGEEIRT